MYKAILVNIVWHWHKDKHIEQWNKVESPEINSHIYGQLDKSTKSIQWETSLGLLNSVFLWKQDMCARVLNHFSHALLFAMLWTIACQAPLSMGSSRQESWRGFHAPFKRIFPTQGLNLCLLCLLHWQAGSLPLAPPRKPENRIATGKKKKT